MMNRTISLVMTTMAPIGEYGRSNSGRAKNIPNSPRKKQSSPYQASVRYFPVDAASKTITQLNTKKTDAIAMTPTRIDRYSPEVKTQKEERNVSADCATITNPVKEIPPRKPDVRRSC